jgi:ABC-2 type transport system permease protein
MTLFQLALRSHLAGFTAATVIGVLLALGNTIGYAQVAGTGQSRAIFAQQMEIVGRQLSYLLPLPSQLDTLSGYLQWRHFGNLPLVYGFWALLAASGAGRGDEERGLVEQWLATGVARSRYLIARALAFVVVAAASVGLMLAAALFGSVVVGETVPGRALGSQGIALLALAFCCFGVGLAVAQLTTTRRAAAGAAGALLLALFLVNSGSRLGGPLEGVRWLSPFWAYDRSTPLLRGGALDVPATVALLAAAIVLVGVSALAFLWRDLGASLLRTAPRTGTALRRPSADPLLRLPVLAIVDQQRLWIAGWALGLSALAAFFVSLTRLMVDALLAVPGLRVYFDRLGLAGYDTFVGVMWGSTALLLLSIYAIAQVSAWVADDAEGRLESVLAQPVSRTRVVLERLGSLLIGSAIVVAIASAAVLWSAARSDITLDAGRFATGSGLMVTVPFAFGAIGALVTGWRPRVAVPVLTVVAIVSYFTQQFAPLFGWPEWVENTSIYALYGTPMSTGVEWGGIAALVALGIAGGVLAIAAMRRRDVGR